jgi:hypothetical protein
VRRSSSDRRRRRRNNRSRRNLTGRFGLLPRLGWATQGAAQTPESDNFRRPAARLPQVTRSCGKTCYGRPSGSGDCGCFQCLSCQREVRNGALAWHRHTMGEATTTTNNHKTTALTEPSVLPAAPSTLGTPSSATRCLFLAACGVAENRRVPTGVLISRWQKRRELKYRRPTPACPMEYRQRVAERCLRPHALRGIPLEAQSLSMASSASSVVAPQSPTSAEATGCGRWHGRELGMSTRKREEGRASSHR